MSEKVVSFGAGYSGIGIAYKLLKYTKPKAEGFRGILVSPPAHNFWNLATIRGVVKGEFEDEPYSTTLGLASHNIETASSLLWAKRPKSTFGRTVPRSRHNQDQRQSTISGNGPTGIKSPRETASYFGTRRDITLIVERDLPLSSLMTPIRKSTPSELVKLGIRLIGSARIVDAHALGIQTMVELLTPIALRWTSTCLYKLLDDRGDIKLEKTLRLVGLGNVWGVSDIRDLETKQLIDSERQTHQLICNLNTTEYGVRELGSAISLQVFIVIDRRKGAGPYSWAKAPVFGISALKGKTFFPENR
ncbi:unnamed protein product [Clonostachys chloroleuca]|uniref:Uncharacterized protein n=1 Tax=Clonostachys chloroleuca TaxID=1926264 RepID=A0AA35LSZ7_9HYPO|nr:unnamed protein product [Clonostachys chloroleuca]